MEFISHRLIRVIYLVWCVGISAFALSSFVLMVQRYLTVRYDYKTEMIVVIGQIGFQWLFMLNSTWKERGRYMFIALTVSMIGSLILLPLILYNNIAAVSSLIAIIYFFVVVGTIFLIHHLLIKKERLPPILSATWVLYRLLILVFVLVPR